MSFKSGINLRVIPITASYSCTFYDDVIQADAALGALIVTLPDATLVPGKQITISKVDSTSNSVTVQGVQTISGLSSRIIYTQFQSLALVAINGVWEFLGVFNVPFTATTTNYTLSPISDSVVGFTTGSSSLTATLPSAVSNNGCSFRIVKTDSGTGTVTVNTTSSQTIGNFNSGALVLGAQNDFISVVSDGANWRLSGFTQSQIITGTSSGLTYRIGLIQSGHLYSGYISASGTTTGNVAFGLTGVGCILATSFSQAYPCFINFSGGFSLEQGYVALYGNSGNMRLDIVRASGSILGTGVQINYLGIGYVNNALQRCNFNYTDL